MASSQITAGSVVVNILGDDTQYNIKLDNAQKKAKEWGDTLSNTFITAAAVKSLFSGALTPLTQTFQAFSNFDFGMSRVQAVAGATAAEMSNLREQAKLLGKTTFFNATQVANAQMYLAQFGNYNTKTLRYFSKNCEGVNNGR
ncbi:MAG: phage tail tape measure protein [Planctomycetaceae bacterium]|jgi:hypothetical protein|nr:phage tail tape measure protein [Planctomycetaceae bacterium]